MGLPRYGIEPRQQGHKMDDLEDAVAFAIFTAHTGDVSRAGFEAADRDTYLRMARAAIRAVATDMRARIDATWPPKPSGQHHG
jgi:hypothetical protein